MQNQTQHEDTYIHVVGQGRETVRSDLHVRLLVGFDDVAQVRSRLSKPAISDRVRVRAMKQRTGTPVVPRLGC
jgi:hypothetical protein